MDIEVYILLFVTLISAKCLAQVPFSCKSCHQTSFTGNPKNDFCFTNASLIQLSDECSTSCYSNFQFENGLVTAVQRGCGSNDQNSNSTNCRADVISDVVRSTCTRFCDSPDCNVINIGNIKDCEKPCSPSPYEVCDFFQGKCVCIYGRSGVNCSVSPNVPPEPSKCFQCDQSIDGDACLNPTSSSKCDVDLPYCFVSHTSTLDQDGEVVHSSVTRGCTDVLKESRDSCVFSSVKSLPANTQVTCTVTCETNQCNDGIPNGIPAHKPLYCLQCSQHADECAAQKSATLCPDGSTYCFANVSYLIACSGGGDADAKSNYHLLHVTRGCSTGKFPTGCSNSTVLETIKKVTCVESCSGNGCNDGWPTRPKCIECEGEYNSGDSGLPSCVLDANPSANICKYPYQEFCFTRNRLSRTTSDFPVRGFSLHVERGCSFENMDRDCATKDSDGVTMEQCTTSCTTDGCNTGNRLEPP